jgi:hypothetical protein
MEGKKQQGRRRWTVGLYAVFAAAIVVALFYAMSEFPGGPRLDRNVPGATTGSGKSSLAD